MKIGFFGGSFNPPTNAHINLAKKAIEEAKLDKVIFIPMGDFYEKTGLEKAKHRLKMLQIACLNSGTNNLEVSDLEIRVNKKLYAIDAFRLIEESYLNDDRYFIMGADNFINLANWKDSYDLIHKYNYIVFEREDIDLKKYINNKFENNVIIIKNDVHKTTSSSKARENLNEDILPKGVLEYIKENFLYKFQKN